MNAFQNFAQIYVINANDVYIILRYFVMFKLTKILTHSDLFGFNYTLINIIFLKWQL